MIKLIAYSSIFNLAILFLACESHKEEVVDLNDIIPTSENYSDSSDTSQVETEKVFETQLNDSILNQYNIQLTNINKIDTILFPNRYNPSDKVMFEYTSNDKTATFTSWNFEQKNGLTVFHNWMNCFGKGCNHFFIGQEIKMQNTGFILLANPENITYITSITKSEATKWIDYFKKAKSKNWDFVVYQSAYQKATWNKMIDGTLEPYEDKTNNLPIDLE